MKKTLTLAMLFAGVLAFAQDAVTQPNYKRFYVNAGADFTDLHNSSNAYAGFEYKFKDESSLGINLFYRNAPAQTGFSAITGTNYGFQLQANHDWATAIGMGPKFDLYTGLNVGFNFQEAHQQGVGFGFPFIPTQELTYNNTAVTVGGQLGIRYFFWKGLGVHLEANANRAVSGDRFDLGVDPREIEFRTGLTYRF